MIFLISVCFSFFFVLFGEPGFLSCWTHEHLCASVFARFSFFPFEPFHPVRNAGKVRQQIFIQPCQRRKIEWIRFSGFQKAEKSTQQKKLACTSRSSLLFLFSFLPEKSSFFTRNFSSLNRRSDPSFGPKPCPIWIFAAENPRVYLIL